MPANSSPLRGAWDDLAEAQRDDGQVVGEGGVGERRWIHAEQRGEDATRERRHPTVDVDAGERLAAVISRRGGT